MQDSVGIDRAGEQQDDDRDHGTAHIDAEQRHDNLGHQRRCDREGRRGTREKREQRKQVDDATEQAVGVLFSDNRETCLRISLTVSFSAMQHEAERDRKHQIKCPRDKAPMENRENACPFRDAAAHFGKMRIGSIHHPLRKGIEQNIRGKTAGEHHCAPGEEVILGLFTGISQYDIAVFGKRHE